jgi:hypothetical protein
VRWASFYIRSFHGFCLVKVFVDTDKCGYRENMLAVQEAEEQGCLPSTEGGHPRLIQEVVHQDDWWYNKLFTNEQAKEYKRVGPPEGVEVR